MMNDGVSANANDRPTGAHRLPDAKGCELWGRLTATVVLISIG
jgi:hypothetical protein